jgi:hypothetical protein
MVYVSYFPYLFSSLLGPQSARFNLVFFFLLEGPDHVDVLFARASSRWITDSELAGVGACSLCWFHWHEKLPPILSLSCTCFKYQILLIALLALVTTTPCWLWCWLVDYICLVRDVVSFLAIELILHLLRSSDYSSFAVFWATFSTLQSASIWWCWTSCTLAAACRQKLFASCYYYCCHLCCLDCLLSWSKRIR